MSAFTPTSSGPFAALFPLSLEVGAATPDAREGARGAGGMGGLFDSKGWPTIPFFGGDRVQGEDRDEDRSAVNAERGGPESDAVLLGGIALGQTEAFQAFYERFGGRVLIYARQLVGGNADRAEDLAQEVFGRPGGCG